MPKKELRMRHAGSNDPEKDQLPGWHQNQAWGPGQVVGERQGAWALYTGFLGILYAGHGLAHQPATPADP